MNIQLLSDLHLESAPAFRAEPAPGAIRGPDSESDPHRQHGGAGQNFGN